MTRQFKMLCLLGLAMLPVSVFGQVLGPSPVAPYQPPPPAPAALLDQLKDAKPPLILLQVDDIIAISVFGAPDLAYQQRISESGTIDYPLLGSIKVAGCTLDEVRRTIADQLVARILVNDPNVTVSAVSLPSRVVSVNGEVEKPGVFQTFGAQTIGDYISQAGGLKNDAAGVVVLNRHSLPQPVVVPLGPDVKTSTYADIPVFPGDTLQFPVAGRIYVIGAFKSQGAFLLKNNTPTTAGQAVALAGGVGYEAMLSNAQILRVEDSKYVLLPIRLDKILDGKAQDIALKSDDILFVPSNSLRAAVKGGGAGLVVSIAAAALVYR